MESLTDPDFWSAYAVERGWVLVGPAVHSYLDEDPGDDGRCRGSTGRRSPDCRQ